MCEYACLDGEITILPSRNKTISLSLSDARYDVAQCEETILFTLYRLISSIEIGARERLMER